MTTAKLNVQFDYVTLRVKFGDGQTLNFTRSRSGTKMSGTAATKAAFEFLDALVASKKNATIGQIMHQLKCQAERSPTMNAFLQIAN